MAASQSVKEEARKIVESLDDNASWDDLYYAMYVHELRQRGAAESALGKKRTLAEVRRHFGLPQT